MVVQGSRLMEALPPSTCDHLNPASRMGKRSIVWEEHCVGLLLWAKLEKDAYNFSFHWLEFSHVLIAKCKGYWEM